MSDLSANLAKRGILSAFYKKEHDFQNFTGYFQPKNRYPSNTGYDDFDISSTAHHSNTPISCSPQPEAAVKKPRGMGRAVFGFTLAVCDMFKALADTA
ncbi:hypothetical protein [Phaeobacter gallaeciensis]|uniref:hypothetical protein n=1 Tax=Phaeobacter gallaeciensis TaxID=60890 RepID=UPI0011AB79BF|nr:hypothetical protein [Phaeobacter gallaeciensis]